MICAFYYTNFRSFVTCKQGSKYLKNKYSSYAFTFKASESVSTQNYKYVFLRRRIIKHYVFLIITTILDL